MATTNQNEHQRVLSAPAARIRGIFGFQDIHLKSLMKAIPVRVVTVGEEIRIYGQSEEDVSQAEEILKNLLQILSHNQEITEKDLQGLLKSKMADPKFATGDEEPGELHQPSRAVGMVTPRTKGQARYMQAISDQDLVFCSGPAGCGKTYLAVAMALEALRTERVRKLVLVRPAVEAGEKLGFLPGDMLAKVNPFLRPLLDALRDMLDFETVQRYMDYDVIEIVPLAFMRGRTLNDTFMILDEAQNTTITQMKMFLTRMGEGSKIVVTGDETQNDLPNNVTSGLTDAMKRLEEIAGTATVRLQERDIVRHRLVREIVKAYDDRGNTRSSRGPISRD